MCLLNLESVLQFDHVKIERKGLEWHVAIQNHLSLVETFSWKDSPDENDANTLNIESTVIVCRGDAPAVGNAGDRIFNRPVTLNQTVTTCSDIQCIHRGSRQKNAVASINLTGLKQQKKPARRRTLAQKGAAIGDKIFALFNKNLCVAFLTEPFESSSRQSLIESLRIVKRQSDVSSSLRQALTSLGSKSAKSTTEHMLFNSAFRHLLICVDLFLKEKPENLSGEEREVRYKHFIVTSLRKQGLSEKLCVAALAGLSARECKFRDLYKVSAQLEEHAIHQLASKIKTELIPYENSRLRWFLDPIGFVSWLFDAQAVECEAKLSLKPMPGYSSKGPSIQEQPDDERTLGLEQGGQYTTHLGSTRKRDPVGTDENIPRKRLSVERSHGSQTDGLATTLTPTQVTPPQEIGIYGVLSPKDGSKSSEMVLKDGSPHTALTLSSHYLTSSHDPILNQRAPVPGQDDLFPGLYLHQVFSDATATKYLFSQ